MVGAYGNGETSYHGGAAYVFARASPWAPQAKLTWPASGPEHTLGFSVAVHGDHVVAGAYGAGYTRGAAYSFDRSGTTWSAATEWRAADGGFGDFFGWAVDYDGVTTIVGAPLKSEERGAAYLW